MNLNHDNVQVLQPLPTLTNNREAVDSNTSAVSALCAPVQSPEGRCDSEQRAPLREISDNTIDLSEVPEQDVDAKQQDNNEDGLANINEYVARILEKLEKQKQKATKLGSALENREKTQQVQDLANTFEDLASQDDENREVDMSSKENLSPTKVRVAFTGKSESISSSPVKEVSKGKINEVLHVSRHSISYGNKFPGQIAEEHLDIVNKSDQDFVVKIEVDCLNEELQDTEEYVYSVRRSHLQEYNDRHYLIMAPYSCASFKFALKVPNVKVKGDIEGQIRVSIDDVTGSYNIALNAKPCTPKVFCPKELRLQGLNYSIIKLAVKEGKKQDFKLPIKNNGPVPVTMELEFYDAKNQNEEENESEQREMFDCLVHPTVLTVPANGSAQLNVAVKPWKSINAKKVEKNKPTRKVLLGKVRDSNLVYSFVFAVEFY